MIPGVSNTIGYALSFFSTGKESPEVICSDCVNKFKVIKSLFGSEKEFDAIPIYDFEKNNLKDRTPTNLSHMVMRGKNVKGRPFISFTTNPKIVTTLEQRGSNHSAAWIISTSGRTFSVIYPFGVFALNEEKVVKLYNETHGRHNTFIVEQHKYYYKHQKETHSKISFVYDEISDWIKENYLLPKQSKPLIKAILMEAEKSLPDVIADLIMNYYFQSHFDNPKGVSTAIPHSNV